MSPPAQRLALAIQLHEQGRLDEAEALYRGILQEEPQNPHALHLLGVRLHQADRHREAIDLIERALLVHGPAPSFHCNLGVAYLSAGRLAEAESHCRAALRLRPDFPDALSNLGLVLRVRGQHDAAADALRAALRLQPDFPDALSNLGLVLQDQGRRAEAADAFRAALRLDPGHADARRNLDDLLQPPGRLAEALATRRESVRGDPGNAQLRNELGRLLLAAGQADEALPHLREAVRLRPDFPEAHRNLGLAQQRLNHVREAMDSFRAALHVNPAHAGARNCLALALQAQGRIHEAITEFQGTLRHEPNDSQAIFSLCQLAADGFHRVDAEEVRRVRELAARTDLPLDAQCRLHFALCLLFDRAGGWDEAFAHARCANELRQEIDRRCGLDFDPDAQRQLVDRLCETFTPAYFARTRHFGVSSDLPVFILGMMRSGTTLAEQILASHPQVHGAGELNDLGALCETGLPKRLAAVEGYPGYVTRLDAATAGAAAEEHLNRLRRLGAGAARVIDKTPTNFLYLGVIATLYPHARVVHCRRDPIDTCLSIFFQNFGASFPFKYDLRHLGRYYREYERLMTHWAAVLPVPVFELRYEELTAEPETISRRLVDFCGLDWDERCLRFHETQRTVWTASQAQVRQPVYRRGVGRWKHYETHLQPLLAELGTNSPPR